MPRPVGWCSSTVPVSPVSPPARPWWWEGLSDIDGMIQIQKLLQGMASVTKVAIGKLEGGQGDLQPLAAGGQGRAGEGLQLESRLHQVEDESGLRYQWSQP